jgi:uncharacterized protein YbbK (DUF523 family)
MKEVSTKQELYNEIKNYQDNILKKASNYLNNNKLLPIGFSSCLIGTKCGWEGDDYTEEIVEKIFKSNKVAPVHFCPEHFSFGTPRAFSSIYDGTGADVLDGKAKVVSVTGIDWTEGSIKGAKETLKKFQEKGVVFSIMTETSPSCGSNVVYKDNPINKDYLRGSGVTATLLQRNDIITISQRDTKTLSLLLQLLDENFMPNDTAIDFVEIEWYSNYFNIK